MRTEVTDLLILIEDHSGAHRASDTPHLCFKQAQPKMCHSPKVDDGVKNNFSLFGPIFLGIFLFKNLELSYILNG